MLNFHTKHSEFIRSLFPEVTSKMKSRPTTAGSKIKVYNNTTCRLTRNRIH